jgi:hypothetical protein
MTVVGLSIAFHVFAMAGSMVLENQGMVWYGMAVAAGTGPVRPNETEDSPSNATREFKTKTGKTIFVSETHPVGRSLSTIAITTKNFEHDFREVYEDQDPISDIFLADLDANGFDELYIITTSTGSGSYGKVIGFASNKDKSLSMIHFPAVEKGDQNFKGYMGHDTFTLENQKLVRLFPIYIEGDTNQNPTGGTRKLTYDLLPEEAMWQLKVKKVSNAERSIEQ